VCVRVCGVPERTGVCISVCACSLAYPARNSYAPYCDVNFGSSDSIIFLTFSKKKATEHKMCILILSTTFVKKIPHSKNNVVS
jgi:hypothetical protein